MARPRSNSKRIKVHLRTNGAYIYAYSYLRNDKDQLRIVNWGRCDDGKFIPGKAFLERPDLWDRLDFPPDLDLSEIDALKARNEPKEKTESKEAYNRLYGHSWLAEEVARQMGLYDDLLAVFHDSEKVDEVLSLAMYPFFTKRGYNHVHIVQETERLPSARTFYPADITLFTQSIGEDDRMKLFERLRKRIAKDEILAVDSTSKSTYGEQLADISWGNNKEGLLLRQTNELVIYSTTRGVPVYYREWEGCMPDVRMVDTMLKDMRDSGFGRSTFITDRGFSAQEVIDMLITKGNAFVLCVRAGVDYLASIREQLGDYRESMEINTERRFYQKQVPFTYHYETARGIAKKAKLTANIYFNPAWKGQDDMDVDIRVSNEEAWLEDILCGRTSADISASALKRQCPLHELEFDESGNLAGYSRNRKKIAGLLKDSGFIAILSRNVDGDAGQIFDIYRKRDEQEKYFTTMKSLLGDRRNRAWSQGGKDGRMFLSFVALSILSYMRHIWIGLGKKERIVDTFEDIFLVMRSIRLIEHSGRRNRMTPFTKKQVDLCKIFSIEVPAACKPKKKKVNARTGKTRKAREKKV